MGSQGHHDKSSRGVCRACGFRSWPVALSNCELIHFIDSNTSLSSLVNGWSRQSDTCHLVGEYWRKACSLQCFPWLERVESESNIADGPTKNDLSFMKRINALEVDADTSSLQVTQASYMGNACSPRPGGLASNTWPHNA